MGRIADALQRAQEARGDAASSPAAELRPGAMRWSRWCDAAPKDVMPGASTDPGSAGEGQVVEGMSEEIVTYYDRSSLISEQYRSLRTRLLSVNPHQAHRIYAVSSAVPKEGKSVTAVNLAFTLAEIRHLRVLLVDGDFRKSELATLVNAAPTPGLADLLRAEASYDEVVHSLVAPNLYFVSAGQPSGRSAPELLSTRAAQLTFKRFEKEFHYTIVDTPPASSVTDVGVIGQMTDGVVFVVRMHRTPEPLARRAIKLLNDNNVPVVGGLVIGEDDSSSGYGHHYSYYGYYRDDHK